MTDSSATPNPAPTANVTAGERFFAYITKYALSQGIECIWAEDVGGGMIQKIDDRNSYPQYYHGEGREWHRSFENAVHKAELMRDAKIISMEKSIKKMRSIDFAARAPAKPSQP